MQINIYGLIGVVLALSSLFIPWTSLSVVIGDCLVYPQMGILTLDSTPLLTYMNERFYPMYCNCTLSKSYPYTTPLISSDVWFGRWLTSDNWENRVGLQGLTNYLCIAALLAFTYSICLGALGFLANGSWSRAGRKSLQIASFLSLSCTVLYLISISWRANLIFEAGFLTPRFQNFGDFYVIASTVYLNLGFVLALSSVASFFTSWMRPKFISLEANVRTPICDKVKRWLAISEKEKLATLFLASLLPVLPLILLVR